MTNLDHVLPVVLWENKGQVMTDALILGMTEQIKHLLKQLEDGEVKMQNSLREGG